jgi:hypothetical protein
MSTPSLQDVVRASRAILPELPKLIGDDAPEVRHRLQLLLARAERGKPVGIFQARRPVDPVLKGVSPFDRHTGAFKGPG